jgi:hypothetical protein
MTDAPDQQEVQCLSSVDPAQWDAMVGDSDDTWLWHTHRWIEATSGVFDLTTRFVLAWDGARPIAGLPVQLRRDWRFGRPWLRAYGIVMGMAGPFAVRDLPARRRRRVLEGVTEAASAWARSAGAEEIHCALPPLARAQMENARGVNRLIHLGWEDTSTHARVADLSSSEDALWSGLAELARRKVRRATRAGYTVERGDWADYLDAYYTIHRETYTRTGAAPFPRAYFQCIADVLAGQGRAALWVGRDAEGRPVAFHNSSRLGDGAQFMSGCSETEHMDSGINSLLFWQAMLGAKEDGYKYYEIGEVFPEARGGKHEGLTTFKDTFGGDLFRLYRGRIALGEPLQPTLLWRAKARAYKTGVWVRDRYSRRARG